MTIKSQTIENNALTGDCVASDQSDVENCSGAQAPCSDGNVAGAVAGACDMAVVLRALGHPARLEIMNALASRGRCFCGEIVDMLPLVQSTVSQHLKVLKEAGLIEGSIDGPRSCYRLNTAMLRDANALIGAMADAADKSAGCD